MTNTLLTKLNPRCRVAICPMGMSGLSNNRMKILYLSEIYVHEVVNKKIKKHIKTPVYYTITIIYTCPQLYMPLWYVPDH